MNNKNLCVGDVMEIPNGDISCVHCISPNRDYYSVYISRYGELNNYSFDTREEMNDYLTVIYNFTDDMINDLSKIIYEKVVKYIL